MSHLIRVFWQCFKFCTYDYTTPTHHQESRDTLNGFNLNKSLYDIYLVRYESYISHLIDKDRFYDISFADFS